MKKVIKIRYTIFPSDLLQKGKLICYYNSESEKLLYEMV